MALVSQLPVFENFRTLYQLIIFCWSLFTTVQDVKCENLMYRTEFTSQDDWMIFQDSIELSSDLMFQCWDKNIFGGITSMVIAKSFFLPPHYLVEVRFEIYDFSTQDFGLVSYLDDQFHTQYYQKNTVYQCNNNNQMSIYYFSIRIFHFSQTLQIQIFRPYYVDSSDLWGINNFELYILQCPLQCHSCDEYGICNDWTYVNSIQVEKSLIFVGGWLKNNEYFNGKKSCGRLQFLGPFANLEEIQYRSIISKAHSKIRLRFKLIVVGEIFQYELLVQIYQQGIITVLDNYPLFSDQHLMCGQYQGINVVDQQFEHNIPNLLILIQISLYEPSPIDFYFGILDFEILVDAQKEDEIEVCNDNNIYAFDGCFNLQFDCSEGCSNCVKGQCLECDSNWLYDPINSNCNSYCGDGLIVGFEECDDSNSIPYDGCYQCQFSCPLNCMVCQYDSCLICNPLFLLINNHCIQNSLAICGDGIIQDLEQCDDGNTIPYDGCFECQYQCEENCKDCQDGTCLESYMEDLQISTCDFGFYLIENKCLSICGDLIVASDEKCDDENNEPFDGCFKCQYSCSLNCQHCIDGLCIYCEKGFYLDNQICQEQCGNGIKTVNEECDDGNIFSEDGCSEICQIEIFWKCIIDEKQRSWCFQINNPIAQLKFLNTTFNKQFILMTSSQQVRLKESHQNITQNLKTSIVNVDPLNFNITFDAEAEPTYEELKFIQYLFTIELLKQLEVELIFHIYFNISLVNNYDLEFLNKELQIKLINPIVLSKEQKEVSQKTSKFNTMMLIILGVSGFIIFLSGNSQDCFEVLDALQYQSYLRFINIDFPENVFIYFESSELISIQTFLVKFNLVDLFQVIFGQEFLNSFGKFYFYSINADLLINLQTQMCQIVLLLLLFIFYIIYNKISQKKCFQSRQLIELKQRNSLVLNRIVIFLYQINTIIMGLGKIFTIEGLRILFLANSWDALFKIILYFFSKPQNSIRTYLSCILGVIIMIFLMTISIYCLMLTEKNRKLRIQKIFRHQGLIVIKKILFLFFLIKAQDNSIIQCLLLALINSFYLGIILIAKLIKDKIDLIVIFWFEVPIIIFTLSSLTHHNDFVKHITNDQQVLIGFCQIGILCFGLISPLIKYSFILIKKGIDYINKRQKQIIAEQQQKIKFEQIFF